MKKEKEKENPVKTWEADADALAAAVHRTCKVPLASLGKDSPAKSQHGQIEKPVLISKRTLEPPQLDNRKPHPKLTEPSSLGLQPDIRVGGSVLQPKSAAASTDQHVKDATLLPTSKASRDALGARSKVPQTKDSAEKASTPPQDGLQLFVGNLPRGCTEEDLRSLFCGFGEIAAIQINGVFGIYGSHASLGFVTFEEFDAVQEVLTYQQHRPIYLSGNQLRVETKKKFKIEPLMDVKILQETRDRIELTYDAKIDKIRNHRKKFQSRMDADSGGICHEVKEKVHLIDGRVVSAKNDLDARLQEIERGIQQQCQSGDIKPLPTRGIAATRATPSQTEELTREVCGKCVQWSQLGGGRNYIWSCYPNQPQLPG